MSRYQVFCNRVNYLRPIEQTTNLLLAAAVREIGIREDVAQCSAAMVFADHMLSCEFLNLGTPEERGEDLGIHIVLLG